MKQNITKPSEQYSATEEMLIKGLNANKGKKSKVVMISLNNVLITVFYDSYKIHDEELIFQLNGRDSCIFPTLKDVEISETVMGTPMIKFV